MSKDTSSIKVERKIWATGNIPIKPINVKIIQPEPTLADVSSLSDSWVDLASPSKGSSKEAGVLDDDWVKIIVKRADTKANDNDYELVNRIKTVSFQDGIQGKRQKENKIKGLTG